MTVSTRLTSSDTRPRRLRRHGYLDHGQPRAGEQPARKRHGGPSEDRALYTCQCGFVFKADVSTSVGCPHCGSTQAW
jgi:rubrerythrin